MFWNILQNKTYHPPITYMCWFWHFLLFLVCMLQTHVHASNPKPSPYTDVCTHIYVCVHTIDITNLQSSEDHPEKQNNHLEIYKRYLFSYAKWKVSASWYIRIDVFSYLYVSGTSARLKPSYFTKRFPGWTKSYTHKYSSWARFPYESGIWPKLLHLLSCLRIILVVTQC